MYIRDAFREQRTTVLFDLIRSNSFGLLTTVHNGKTLATHLPFIVDEDRGDKGTLIGHFARVNSHWQHIDATSEALVVFQGPHTYISPTWYDNQLNVPTWNYTAVHVRGQIKLIENKTQLRTMVMNMVQFYESENDQTWDIEKADTYISKLLAGIVGIELPISSMEGQFKLSQNKPVKDQNKVIARLSNSDDPMQQKVANLMRTNQKDAD